MSENWSEPSGFADDEPLRPVLAIVALAELHPTTPIRVLISELRHADQSVPAGADDRDEIIARIVSSRLSTA